MNIDLKIEVVPVHDEGDCGKYKIFYERKIYQSFIDFNNCALYQFPKSVLDVEPFRELVEDNIYISTYYLDEKNKKIYTKFSIFGNYYVKLEFHQTDYEYPLENRIKELEDENKILRQTVYDNNLNVFVEEFTLPEWKTYDEFKSLDDYKYIKIATQWKDFLEDNKYVHTHHNFKHEYCYQYLPYNLRIKNKGNNYLFRGTTERYIFKDDNSKNSCNRISQENSSYYTGLFDMVCKNYAYSVANIKSHYTTDEVDRECHIESQTEPLKYCTIIEHEYFKKRSNSGHLIWNYFGRLAFGWTLTHAETYGRHDLLYKICITSKDVKLKIYKSFQKRQLEFENKCWNATISGKVEIEYDCPW